MLAIKIKQCLDQQRWYADMIGQTVPYHGVVYNPLEYRSRDPNGFVNFVQPEDSEIVEFEENE